MDSLSGESAGFISLVAMVELVWVLTSCYQTSNEKVGEVVETVLRATSYLYRFSGLRSEGLRVAFNNLELFCAETSGNRLRPIALAIIVVISVVSEPIFDRQTVNPCELPFIVGDEGIAKR